MNFPSTWCSVALPKGNHFLPDFCISFLRICVLCVHVLCVSPFVYPVSLHACIIPYKLLYLAFFHLTHFADTSMFRVYSLIFNGCIICPLYGGTVTYLTSPLLKSYFLS